MTDLSTVSTKELVGIYNGLGPDKPLKSYKGKREVLVKRIEALLGAAYGGPPVRHTAEPKREVTEEPVPQSSKPGTTGKQSGRTIRAAAVELLCTAAYHEDRTAESGPDNVVDSDHPQARSVGLAYDEILRRIRAEFPNCQTSAECLRWYSVKIRVEEHSYEGLRLPQRRPRVKPRSN